MAAISTIVGITLMVIGGLFVVAGMVLCYTTKGEYYNQDEVQAMVAAEVLEEEKRRKYETEVAEQAIKEMIMQEEASAAVDNSNDGGASAGEKGMVATRKKRGPMIAS